MGVIGKPSGGSIENRVKLMKVGEEGYISHWELEFDFNAVPYLNLNATVSKKKGKGTVPIKRTGPNNQDYQIDLRNTRLAWELVEYPFKDEEEDYTLQREIVALDYKEVRGSKPVKAQSRLSLQERLNQELTAAVASENYERAATLRDKLGSMRK